MTATGHFTMIKGTFIRKTIILNVYTPTNKTLEYIKQKLTQLKREINKFIIVVGHFYHTLLLIDRRNRQNISKYTYRLFELYQPI